MATKTRAEMIDLVLKRLGILGAGQSATAEDAVEVGGVIDAMHAELRPFGLVPFAKSAFPEWAQEGFAKVVGETVAPAFGMSKQGWRKMGERDLSRQMQAKRHRRAIEVDYF